MVSREAAAVFGTVVDVIHRAVPDASTQSLGGAEAIGLGNAVTLPVRAHLFCGVLLL